MAEQEGDLLTTGTEGQPAAQGNPAPDGSGGSAATPVKDSPARPGWMDQLKGDLKDHDGLRKFESATDLAKSYVELEGKLGKAVTISEEPTAEELSRVRALLGVPGSAEKYDFSGVKLPEGFKFTEDYLKEYATFALSQGKTPAQANADLQRIAEKEHAAIKAVRQLIATQRSEAETKLRQDLGANYDATLKAANTLLQTYGDKEFTARLKDSGYVNDPGMVRFLGKIGLAVSEASAPRGGAAPKTPEYQGPYPFAAKIAEDRNKHYE